MASKSEQSFGARVANAAKIRDSIKTFNDYAPPRDTERLESYTKCIEKASASNETVAICLDNYNKATQARIQQFRTDELSVLRLLSPVGRAVMAQYGKGSREDKLTSSIIANLRSAKISKKAVDSADTQKISQSEQSYGSITQSFKNLVATLGNFEGYNPSRFELTLPTLAALSGTLDDINQNVNTTLSTLRKKRSERTECYDDLRDRTLRIKAYVSAQYGLKSAEFKSISSLKV